LDDQIKICHRQVLLKNSEDSHAKKQCFYMPPFTLFAKATVLGLNQKQNYLPSWVDVESLIRVTKSDQPIVDKNSRNITPLGHFILCPYHPPPHGLIFLKGDPKVVSEGLSRSASSLRFF
jgi:hypothetical protein